MSGEIWGEKPKPKRGEEDEGIEGEKEVGEVLEGKGEMEGENPNENNLGGASIFVLGETCRNRDSVKTDSEKSPEMKKALESTLSSEEVTPVSAFGDPLPQRSRVKDQRSASPGSKKNRDRNCRGVEPKEEEPKSQFVKDGLSLLEGKIFLEPEPSAKTNLTLEPGVDMILTHRPNVLDQPQLPPKDNHNLRPRMGERLNVPAPSKTKKRSLTPEPFSVTKTDDDNNNYRDPSSAGSTKEWPSVRGSSNCWPIHGGGKENDDSRPMSFSSMARNLSNGGVAFSNPTSNKASGIF